MDISCFQNVIGLHRGTCPCKEPPTGYNNSASGLFLSDLAPFDQLDGLSDCASAGNIWATMSAARDEAIRTFIADANALMIRKNRFRREPYSGVLGELGDREVLSIPTQYAGARIAVAPVRSGQMVVRNIAAIFDTAGTFSLRVFNSLNQQIGDPITITTEMRRLRQNPVSIKLPLFSPFADPLEYFFVFEVADSGNPMCVKAHCGCGGFNPVFDKSNPHFEMNMQGSKAWANWAMVGTWQGSSLDAFDQCDTTASGCLNGLLLDVRFECNPTDALCDGEMNFVSNPLALSIAFAIRYKAAEILADRLLMDAGLNRQTLITRDALREAKKEWSAKYNENTAYIGSNAPVNGGDCLECKPLFEMKMAGVFS